MTPESQGLQRARERGPDGFAPYEPAPRRDPAPWRDQEPETDATFEVRRVLSSLLRRRWQILGVAAAVIVPVTIATLLTTPEYVSSALVEIEPEPVQVLPFREFDNRNQSNYETFMKSQEQLLRSPTLATRVAERVTQNADTGSLRAETARLEKQFSVQRIENTQIFRLTYGAPDPNVAATVANMFAEEYIKRHYENRQDTREKARQFLQRELQELEQRVQESEKNLVDYAQAHRLPVGDQPGQGLGPQRLAELNQELTRAEGEVFMARAKSDALRRSTVTDFPEKLSSAVITTLQGKLVQLENDLTNLRATYGENWPAVVQKRGEVALVTEQLLREKTAALQQAREQAALELAASENRRRMLEGSVTTQQAQVNTLESASIQYNILRREVETNRKMYDGLLERLKQTGLISGMDLGGFRIVEAARPPDSPDSPRLWWNVMLASLLGLALGLCVALVRDYWDTTVSTVEEVEHLTVLPVLGVLPVVRQDRPTSGLRGLAGRLRLGSKPDDLDDVSQPATALTTADGAAQPGALQSGLSRDPVVAESVRNLCASILLSRSGHPPKILMVTSSVPGEGKSTIVGELGQALAESGARTLLVECDMRRPRLAQQFGLTDEGGLSLFLAGHTGSSPKIHPTSNGDLFVVTVGPPPPNPPALLKSDKLRDFLQDMSQDFQFVILDAPPVLPIADARVVAPMTEGVILVVRAGRASKQLVRRVCDMLHATGANVLGAVLNGAESVSPGGSDYKYYRSYYGH